MKVMEIHQLRYFCAVARKGSFVKAAESEDVAQPSLSQQIRKLEEELGAPLFERLGRSIRLTQFGEHLLPQAIAILRQLEDAKSSLEALQTGVRGRLRIGCIPTILPYYLAPFLSGFQALYPDLTIELREDVTSKLVELLQAGEIDLAILALPVKNPDLVCSELYREPLRLAVSKNHPLASADGVNLRDVLTERMLLLREGHCLRNDVLTACSRARAEFQSVFESDQLASIFSLVSAGFGVSLVPELAQAHANGCRLLPLRREAFRRIGYAQARRHFVTPAQKAFVQWLRKKPA
jgi:LysR family hydrogen peroxide-inducible transcriptional activator